MGIEGIKKRRSYRKKRKKCDRDHEKKKEPENKGMAMRIKKITKGNGN